MKVYSYKMKVYSFKMKVFCYKMGPMGGPGAWGPLGEPGVGGLGEPGGGPWGREICKKYFLQLGLNEKSRSRN